MSVRRSPPKYADGLSFTGSQPDLSALHLSSDTQITLRKRKLPDCEGELKSELKNDISNSHNEIMSFLKDFRNTHDGDMKFMRSEMAEVKGQLCTLKTTVEKISSEHNIFRSELSDLADSLSFHAKKQEDLNCVIDTISAETAKLSTVQGELAECKSSLSKLQQDYNIQQQRDRMYNLEISGIPERKTEDLRQCLLSICTTLGVQLSNNEVVHIHRVPTRVPNKPKNIVARMSTILAKDSIISAIRKKKGITTSDIGISNREHSARIYINEHLTPFYKTLYKKTRETASEAKYEHVWVRNCKIFVRRNDSSPPINIQDYKDIGKIK